MFTESSSITAKPNAAQRQFAMFPSPSAPSGDQGRTSSASCILERFGSGRILVIEDDAMIRTVLSRALVKLGFTATLAADGAEALPLFRADPSQFVAAILDFKLPGMTSAEVLCAVRSQRPDLPVLLTSGYDRDEAVNRSAGMNVTSFLHKPFTVDSLASELRLALGA
jgi:two-component system cell cycle sensor histidine kinase/response regulator CckA